MFDETIFLYDYTEILLGKKKNYSNNFFSEGARENEFNAVQLIRTVTKTFLKCNSLAAARETITPEILRKLKLDTVIPYIRRPKFIPAEDKDAYVLARIYTNNFNVEQWTAYNFCRRIRDGTLEKFPKYYMNDAIGKVRAQYCLWYFIMKDYPFSKVIDLYRFASSKEFETFLKKNHLLSVMLKQYRPPVEFMHDAIPKEHQSTLLCQMYGALQQLGYSRNLSCYSEKEEGGEDDNVSCPTP